MYYSRFLSRTSVDPLYYSPTGTCHMAFLPTTDTCHTTGWARSYGPSMRVACSAAKTCSRALCFSATHLKLIVLFSQIRMWAMLILEMEEAHQHSAYLSMVRCMRCNNLFFILKRMSWQTLMIGELRIYDCDNLLNLNKVLFSFPLVWMQLIKTSNILDTSCSSGPTNKRSPM